MNREIVSPHVSLIANIPDDRRKKTASKRYGAVATQASTFFRRF
jgi:hypothetical protein